MKLHKIVFHEVEKIININDPIGLVSGGAPDDEYHDEINKIISILRTESDKNGLMIKIKNIFNNSFKNVDLEKIKIIAEELIELKKRLKW